VQDGLFFGFFGGKMKKNVIIGAVVLVIGLLIALGPQFVFKACSQHEDGVWSHCHWSVQAELGIGLLIAALGVCMMVFADPKTHFGLTIGTFLAGFVAVFIPHFLIGGCANAEMACHKVAFPALTIESVVLMVCSIVYIVYLEKKHSTASAA